MQQSRSVLPSTLALPFRIALIFLLVSVSSRQILEKVAIEKIGDWKKLEILVQNQSF